MASNDQQSILYSLLQGVSQRQDPRLYDLLKVIIAQISNLNSEVFPVVIPETVIPEPVFPPDPTDFIYSLILDGVRFTWARPSFDLAYFELRSGAAWDSADRILLTPSTSAIIDPLLVGTHHYLLRGVSSDGTLSAGTLELDVIVPPLGTINASASVIDNNVLLTWSAPTSSFRIDHYVVTKNGVAIGTLTGTFIAVFEQVAGTYNYGISAVDIAGNISPEAIVPASVTQPPDYILLATEIDSLFDGTRTDVYRYTDPYQLLASVRDETFEDHFLTRGWACIQDQLDDGYPLYIQPSVEIGKYVKVFDYGAIFSNVLINISYTSLNVYGTVNVTVSIEVSLDSITWSSPIVGSSVFAASVRYVRVTLDFDAVA